VLCRVKGVGEWRVAYVKDLTVRIYSSLELFLLLPRFLGGVVGAGVVGPPFSFVSSSVCATRSMAIDGWRSVVRAEEGRPDRIN
jgi:hypothetical protein